MGTWKTPRNQPQNWERRESKCRETSKNAGKRTEGWSKKRKQKDDNSNNNIIIEQKPGKEEMILWRVLHSQTKAVEEDWFGLPIHSFSDTHSIKNLFKKKITTQMD